MTAIIEGDYSKYPASIREVFPHLAGEACELRDSWTVYSHLFMEKKELTDRLGERLGGVLGIFQSLLQDQMFLSIARLTDKDSRAQTNLSLWSLLPSVADARDADFGKKVETSLNQICAVAAGVRKHRHKRIAHFDLGVSLSTAILPVVTFEEIRRVLEQIETFLNLFYWEFETHDDALRRSFGIRHYLPGRSHCLQGGSLRSSRSRRCDSQVRMEKKAEK